MKLKLFSTYLCVFFLSACLHVSVQPDPATREASSFDADLAASLEADDYGMHSYVMVVLKTGPKDQEITDPEIRQALFAGHFANMKTWAEAGQLVLAGPFSDPDGIKRGLYIFDVDDIDAAKALVETDPTVANGIFVAEYTPYYGSAALKTVNETHLKIQKTAVE